MASTGIDALAQVVRWKLQSATDAQGGPIAAALQHGTAVHALVFTDGNPEIEGGCNHIGARYRIDAAGRWWFRKSSPSPWRAWIRT